MWKKYFRARQASEDNMEHAHTHTHTLTVCNSYCFSTAAMVVRMLLTFTFYVHWLFCHISQERRCRLWNFKVRNIMCIFSERFPEAVQCVKIGNTGLGVGTMWLSLQLLVLKDGLVMWHGTYQEIRLIEYNMLLMFMYSIGGIVITVVLLRK